MIGVDEHTALVFDLAEQIASVLGNGTVTVRHDGSSRVLPSGTTVEIASLSTRESAQSGARVGTDRRPNVTDPAPAAAASSLRDAADRARTAFDAALAVRDAEAAAAAVLELEQAISDWTADTLQSDDGDHARRTLRGMVLELAGAARDGLADPVEKIAPLVEALIERRAAAREAKDFATSDALRNRLAEAGVEVRDGADGAEWSLRS